MLRVPKPFLHMPLARLLPLVLQAIQRGGIRVLATPSRSSKMNLWAYFRGPQLQSEQSQPVFKAPHKSRDAINRGAEKVTITRSPTNLSSTRLSRISQLW